MDTQVITGIGDKFHFIEAKENFLYEEGKKTDKKDGIVTIVTEENPTEFTKVKVNGTLNDDVSSYKLYDSIDFENLTE